MNYGKNKSKEEAAVASTGIPLLDAINRSSSIISKLPKKWDPRDANLVIGPAKLPAFVLQKEFLENPRLRSHNRVATETDGIIHLNTQQPRKEPFPYLRRPTPPPLPILVSRGLPSNSEKPPLFKRDGVPKIPSFAREASRNESGNGSDKLLKKQAPLRPRTGKTKLNEETATADLPKKKPVPLAEQVRHWERHLRPAEKVALGAKMKKSKKSVAQTKSRPEFPRPILSSIRLQQELLRRLQEHRRRQFESSLDLSGFYPVNITEFLPTNATIERAKALEKTVIAPFDFEEMFKIGGKNKVKTKPKDTKSKKETKTKETKAKEAKKARESKTKDAQIKEFVLSTVGKKKK